MEPTPDKLMEDITMDENFNPIEMLNVFIAAFSVEEKKTICNLLFEDFKRFFLEMGSSVVNSSLNKKARFVSIFGYSYQINLYDELKNFIIDHLRNSRKPHVLSSPKNTFIKTLTTTWEIFKEALTTTNNIMEYMGSYHTGHNKLGKFDKFAEFLFREIVFMDKCVHKNFFTCLSELKQVTTRDIILLNSDRLLIENVSKMCIDLRIDYVYEMSIKSFFIKLTTEYFQLLSEEYLFQYCTCSYFENAHAKLVEEMSRIQLKLDSGSINEIRGIITTELFLKNMKTIVEMESCGVVYMLENDQFDDLKCVYNNLVSVDGGLKVMFDSICPYFNELGTSIVLKNKEISDAFTCIQSLLNLIDKFDYLLKNVFDYNNLFYQIIGNEFGVFLKLNSLIPLFLCRFIDEKLRRKKFMLVKNHSKGNLHKLGFLVEHLQDKSSFEKSYRVHLFNRLLYCQNIDMQLENILINLIKTIYTQLGINSLFVPRIEGMCKDKFLLSKSIMDKYNEHVLVDKCILGIMRPFDLNVNVLSKAYWPVEFPKSMCKIPSFALNAFNEFKEFYLKNETKKTLTLLPQCGTAELEVTYYSQPEATKQSCDDKNSTTKIERVEHKFKVVVSTYQMFVLDLFNSNDFLTYETILKETKIPEKSLLYALQKLMYTHKLLIKRPICKEIQLSDTFYVSDYLKCI